MLIGFLLIWCLLFVVLKYDLKQNNTSSIVRATCFTLISYILLDIKFKEYFNHDSNTESNNSGAINMPDSTTIEENPITTQANSYKKTDDRCKYVQEQQRLTVNSLYQNLKDLNNASSINNTQIDVLQKNFNDLITVRQVGDVCSE